MPATRRVIRKTEPRGPAPFEEQFWPVLLSLFALGGFLMASVAVYLPLHGPHWFDSAFTWLFVIPIGMCLLIWALRHVHPRRVRRGVQLAAILCVLAHAVLLIITMEATVFSRPWPEKQVAPKPVPRRRVVAPDYSPVQLASQEKRKSELFRPVQSRLPEPVQRDVSPEQELIQQPSTREQPLPAVESQPSPEPQVIPRPQVAETAPRQSDRMSQLSRSLAAAPPRSAEPVEQPELTPATDRPLPLPTPQTSQPQRATAAATMQPRPAEATPDRADTTRPAQLARSESPTVPRAEAAGAAAPRRAVADPLRAPPTAAEGATPPVPHDRAVTQLAPRPQEAPRQAVEGPQRERVTPASDPLATATTSAPRTEPRSREPLAPAVDALSQPNRPARTSLSASTATDQPPTSVAVPSVPTPSDARADRSLASPRTDLARQARGSESALSRAGRQPAEVEQRPEPLADTRSARRTAVAPAPTLDPAADPAPRPARSVAAGQIAASPANVEAPAASRTERGLARPRAEPGRWSLAQSTSGTAGIGSSANLDRASPSAASPATSPSGSARRMESTQALPTGGSLAPSQPSRTPRSLAGVDAPAAAIRATVTDSAVLPASETPGELTASSSAALTRAASNAPPATVTAAQGTIDLDVGPTLVVGEAGRGRASGGGQPQLNPQTDAPATARRPPGGRPQPAISTLAEAIETVAPGGSGGGQPLAPSESPSLEFAAGSSAHRPTPAGGPNATEPTATAGDPAGQWVESASGNPRRAERSPAVASGEPGRAVRDASSPARRSPAAPMVAGGLTADSLPVDAAEPPSDALATARPTDLAASWAAIGPSLDSRQALGGAATGTVAGAVRRSLEGRTDDTADPGRGLLERSAGPGPSPELPLGNTAQGPRAKRTTEPLPIDTRAAEVESLSPSDTSVAAAGPLRGHAPSDSEIGRLAETQAAIRVDIAGNLGSGGLGSEASLSAGLSDRRLPRESFQISPRPTRFVRQDVGGLPDLNTTAAIPTPPYRRRLDRTAGGSSDAHVASPSPQTEAAVELGLEFLARCQQARGNWTLQSFPEDTTFVSDTAATALALLAFQGAGYTHREHRYASQVMAGLRSLIANQKPSGDLYLPMDEESNRSSWLYSHAIAALALCEAYGMTQDPALKEPAQRALNFVASSQDKTYGGWRYNPGSGADTSVSGWMMMALKSGELAGLEVPAGTYQRTRQWLDAAQHSDSQPHLYRYNPYAPNTPTQRHGRVASETMTAVGLLMRLYDGWRRDREAMIQGAEYLQQHLPSHGTASNPDRDTYYWYYGTQVMFHMGGDYWEQWNRRLHPLLVDTQIKQGPLAGSWDPQRPVPDRWGPQAGRLYVTTMNLLSLEVYYRHLPLYENTAR